MRAFLLLLWAGAGQKERSHSPTRMCCDCSAASGWLLFQDREHVGRGAQLTACPALLEQSPPAARVDSGLLSAEGG